MASCTRVPVRLASAKVRNPVDGPTPVKVSVSVVVPLVTLSLVPLKPTMVLPETKLRPVRSSEPKKPPTMGLASALPESAALGTARIPASEEKAMPPWPAAPGAASSRVPDASVVPPV
jgi:hypothetical protein